jgi:hypothetical protein
MRRATVPVIRRRRGSLLVRRLDPMHYKLLRQPDTIVGLRTMILLNAPELGSKRGLNAAAEPQAHGRSV